jgi:MFS family permease
MPGRSLFRSLSHRNFRLFFLGQSLSLIGTWTQTTTMLWLMSRLAPNEAIYGLVGFIATSPAFLFPPLAGVITDRVDRRRLLMVTQSLAMTQAFVLAIVVATGKTQLWQVGVLNFILSVVNSFDLTARQTFLGDMIDDRSDLANAIALHSTMINGARLFGPSLAAWLLITIGEEGCFFINGFSFLAVLAALAAIRTRRHVHAIEHPPLLAGLREGFGYVQKSRPIRSALIVVATVSLFGLPYNALMPYFTKNVLHEGPGIYGLLMTAPGIGAFAACLYIAQRGLKGLTRRLVIGPLLSGICLVLLSYSRSPNIALILLLPTGFGFMMLLNAANTLLQSISDDDKRGRVLSYYSIAFTGMAPFGTLIVPSLANAIDTPAALFIGGSMCILVGLWLVGTIGKWRPEVRAKLAPKPVTFAESEIPVTG